MKKTLILLAAMSPIAIAFGASMASYTQVGSVSPGDLYLTSQSGTGASMNTSAAQLKAYISGGLTFTTSTGTLTIANAKTLDVTNTLTLSGADGLTLNIGAGGALGTAAFDAASAFDSSGAASTAQSNAETYAANASNLSSGTVAIGRLPTGTTGSTVAIGNDSRITGALQTSALGTGVDEALIVPLNSSGAVMVYGGVMNFDSGLIFSDGNGNLTMGTISSDAGAIFSDGNGNLAATGRITMGTISSDAGAIYSDGNGNFFAGGFGIPGGLNGEGLAIQDEAGLLFKAYDGYTAGDYGQWFSNGYGGLNMTSLSSDDDGIMSDGLGDLTLQNLTCYGGMSNTLGNWSIGDNGAVSFDAGAISSDGNGNLIAFSLTDSSSGHTLASAPQITASGTFTLSSGAATISAPAVDASSVILVTVKTVSGTRTGNPDIVPTAGTGFTAAGGSLDNSTYNYVVLQ